MNDEQAVRRGLAARQALDAIEPILAKMNADALDKLLTANSDTVLAAQLYAKAIAEVEKTLRRHITDGETAQSLAAQA